MVYLHRCKRVKSVTIVMVDLSALRNTLANQMDLVWFSCGS
jgi:hypothetical protein